jgi:curved DNA-binding protein CbpA
VGRGAYGILGVAADASDAEIRDSYHTLVKKLHPDVVGGNEEQFKRVSRAYGL